MFELSVPIIQSPMAGVQDSGLAIAVSQAGGLGSVPGAMRSPQQLREDLLKVTSSGKHAYNVNFFCHTAPAPDPERERAWRARLQTYYAEYEIEPEEVAPGPGRSPFNAAMVEVLEEFSPPVISFHFGLPSPALLRRVKAMGSWVISSATTLAEALWLQSNGVDAVIAQGVEAGGHRGMFLSLDISTQVGTFALLPQLVSALDVPVIAAGGIADAAGVKAALSLGASSVQIGTAFLLCPEATTRAVHRSVLATGAGKITALTNLFSGRPARSVVNRLMREQGPMSDYTPAFPTAGAALAPLRARAEASGGNDFSALWAGQNITGCREIPAAELLQQLASGIDSR